eukprot:m.118616 g.118616  ORF g.118616 m.118616 type:complete len:158 (-) comp13657_c2_seq4:233-706(-)
MLTTQYLPQMKGIWHGFVDSVGQWIRNASRDLAHAAVCLAIQLVVMTMLAPAYATVAVVAALVGVAVAAAVLVAMCTVLPELTGCDGLARVQALKNVIEVATAVEGLQLLQRSASWLHWSAVSGSGVSKDSAEHGVASPTLCQVLFGPLIACAAVGI